MKQESEFSKQAQAPDSTPKLNLGFKEGQTITLNIGVIFYKVSVVKDIDSGLYHKAEAQAHFLISSFLLSHFPLISSNPKRKTGLVPRVQVALAFCHLLLGGS